MKTLLSFFQNPRQNMSHESFEFTEYLNGIKYGKWKDLVEEVRNIPEKEKQKEAKMKLPCVTVSGKFNKREKAGLIEHSGIVCLDFDQQDNFGVDLIGKIKHTVSKDPYVICAHSSVGGQGLAVYVKIKRNIHEGAYPALEKYFADKYKIIADPSAKDVARLRFVSHDPELYINEKSETWTDVLKAANQTILHDLNHQVIISSDIERIIKELESLDIDITRSYHDWIKIGIAFARKFKEDGRDYFHQVSRLYSDYDEEETDRKFTNLLQAGNHEHPATIGTFLRIAKDHGVNIKSDETRQIEDSIRLRLKSLPIDTNPAARIEAGESAKIALLAEGFEEKDIDEVLDQIMAIPQDQLHKSRPNDLIETCAQLIILKGVIFNEITTKLEVNGITMSDYDINSLFLDVKQTESRIRRDIFDTVLRSNRIPRYNPFKKFICENIEKGQNANNIGNLLSCIHDEMSPGYKEIFVKKWLLSMIASAHGIYSSLILVLTGPQNTGKTSFFRLLLPQELGNYYAESKLDSGKDDEILMTQKLLIVDDEFGGKSKKEAKKLKDISSKQCFNLRKPYGRESEDLPRLACLGGTSNEDDVIYDLTGNRRVLPVKIKKIDLEKYNQIDKTELFMELYHEWKRIGDGWMLTTDEIEILRKDAADHEEETPELDIILKHFEKEPTYTKGLTSTDITIKLKKSMQLVTSPKKIGLILKKLGYEQRKMNDRRIWNICLKHDSLEFL